jgi:glycosyltransferase involved in cell wall biosynthesis
LPVLATRVPGNESVIEDGISGLLLPAHDVDAWSHAVRRLMADPSLRMQIARNGRARVCLEHDFESSLDRMADLFETVVASK